jgi:hypothetical protein
MGRVDLRVHGITIMDFSGRSVTRVKVGNGEQMGGMTRLGSVSVPSVLALPRIGNMLNRNFPQLLMMGVFSWICSLI